jgi:hypothetical protein
MQNITGGGGYFMEPGDNLATPLSSFEVYQDCWGLTEVDAQ